SKNSLAVGELLARANSAEAKSGSRASALSKCCRESCARSFSARSRPCRNSFFASSDFVVTGTLPPPLATGDIAPVLELLQPVNTVAVSERIAAKVKRSERFERIGLPPSEFMRARASRPWQVWGPTAVDLEIDNSDCQCC